MRMRINDTKFREWRRTARLALFNLPNFGNFLVSYLKLNVRNKDFYLVKDLERWPPDGFEQGMVACKGKLG